MHDVLALIGAVIALSLPLGAIFGLGWAALYRWRVALAFGTVMQSVWVALGGVALAVYAVVADRGNDWSAMEAHSAHTTTVAGLLVGGVVVLILVSARRSGSRGQAAVGFICSAVAVLWLFVGFVANTPLHFS